VRLVITAENFNPKFLAIGFQDHSLVRGIEDRISDNQPIPSIIGWK
jgi:hypothetical protein